MEKRTIVFWKSSEIKAAKTAIEKFGGNVAKASEWLAPKLNRTSHAVQQKMGVIVRGTIRPTVEERKARIVKSPEKSLALPKGFSFDFTPKRAEMFKDHVRLYF